MCKIIPDDLVIFYFILPFLCSTKVFKSLKNREKRIHRNPDPLRYMYLFEDSWIRGSGRRFIKNDAKASSRAGDMDLVELGLNLRAVSGTCVAIYFPGQNKQKKKNHAVDA